MSAFTFRPMFGGLDSELRAAFGSSSEGQISYNVKNRGATLESQLLTGTCEGDLEGEGMDSPGRMDM